MWHSYLAVFAVEIEPLGRGDVGRVVSTVRYLKHIAKKKKKKKTDA